MKPGYLAIVIVLLLPIIFLLYLSLIMGQKPLYFPKLIANSLIHRQSVDQARFNLMVLGLDPRDDILEQTLTTDTIILVSLNLKKYQLTTISLPRDLWDYSLKQKINQIYPQAVKDYSPNIYPFLQGQYQRFLGQPIDRTLIVTTQNLKELIAWLVVSLFT